MPNTIKNNTTIEYDPLDNEIDFSKLKKIDPPFTLSNKDKVKVYMDGIFYDSKIEKKELIQLIDDYLNNIC